MKWTVVIALVVGCGAPARAPEAPKAAAVPAPHYAALFQAGKAWTYHVVSTNQMYEPGDPKADKDGMVKEQVESTVRCEVAETRAWAKGVMSRIACDKPLVDKEDPFLGGLVADARGLWLVDELPAAGAEPDLADARLVIAAAPTAGKTERKGTGDEEGFGESTEIVEKDGAWCVTYASWGGDESYDTLCFAAAGVVKGGGGWSGGSTHETTFELVP
jgi:hypothetical protein